MKYDVIVIGTGPAGLSAAITLKIRNKNVLVVGKSSVSEKVSKAHGIQNYLGIKQVSGEDLANRMLGHATSLGVEIKPYQINSVYYMGDGYTLSTTTNEFIESSSVIIATGVLFGKPYEGEDEFLGKGVSYCATCDAPLYKQKKVIIIGSSKKEEHEANFMSEICSEVIYIPLYKGDVDTNEKVKVVYCKPIAIRGQMKANAIETDIGTIEADGIFILRESVAPDKLVPGLLMDGNHIKVDRLMQTNLPGAFACGDIVGAPYQYIKAAGEGNIAAISAVSFLNKK